jgi:hypothetical protein
MLEIPTSQNDTDSIKKMDISQFLQKKTPKEKKIEKKEKSKRVITQNDFFLSLKEDLSFDTQFRVLNEVITCYDYNNKYHRLFISQIKSKIYGYSYQDEAKHKLEKDTFIDISNVLQKLLNCKMECFYCKKPVKVLYEYVREDDQWTLERIDNKEGHNTNNVEIACLNCNLRRRTMYHERYIFTKQIKNIKKLN